MAQTILNIRMDENLKTCFDYICDELGMNMSTAITIFAKRVCRDRGLPFDLSLPPINKNEENDMNKKIFIKANVGIIGGGNMEAEEKYSFSEKFNDLEEAYRFAKDKIDSISYSDEYDNKGTPIRNYDVFFGFEVLDPNSAELICVGQDLIDGCLYYKKGNEEKNIPIGEDGDYLQTAYGFLQAILLS